MTLKEFADKSIVQTIPSVVCWISFIAFPIVGPSSPYFDYFFVSATTAIIAMSLINGIRGIKPPASSGQSWGDRTVSDPIYRHLPGNTHHRH